jgi:AraC-like DNA-binding protein
MDGGKAVLSVQDRALILGDDSAIYNALKAGFGDVVSAVNDIKNAKGAVVIGANAIFDNAGSIAALQEAHDADGVVKFAVWAEDGKAKKALEELGVGNFATIHLGLKSALKAVAEARIAQEKIALINSDIDVSNIESELSYAERVQFLAKVKKVYVETPKPGAAQHRINAMPLVFAKAFAMIFDTQEAVRQQLQNLAHGYADKGLISAEDIISITRLATELSSVPLVTVNDELAAIQMTFADTLNKI